MVIIVCDFNNQPDAGIYTSGVKTHITLCNITHIILTLSGPRKSALPSFQ